MTKDIFAKSIGKAIPVVGAVVSGGLTFVGFKPITKRLQKYLITLPMASVDFYKEASYNSIIEDIIDIDFSDVIVDN